MVIATHALVTVVVKVPVFGVNVVRGDNVGLSVPNVPYARFHVTEVVPAVKAVLLAVIPVPRGHVSETLVP